MEVVLDVKQDSLTEIVKNELLDMIGEDMSSSMSDEDWYAFNRVVKYFMTTEEILEHYGEEGYEEFFNPEERGG